ncbi:MAG: hypothetical protein ACLQF1_20100 [Methyloceanibacter sp.]
MAQASQFIETTTRWDSLLLRVLIVRLRIWLVKRKLNLAGWLETRQPR